VAVTTTPLVAGRQAPAVWLCIWTILVSWPGAGLGLKAPVKPADDQASRAAWTVMPLSDGTVMQPGVGVGFGVAVGFGVGVGLDVGTGVGFGVGPGFGVDGGFEVRVGVAPPPVPPAGVAAGLGGLDGAIVGPAEAPTLPAEPPDPDAPGDSRAPEPVLPDGTKTAPSTPPVVRIPPPRVTASTTATTASAAAAIERRASIRRSTEATRTRGVTAPAAGTTNGNAQAGHAPAASAQHHRHEYAPQDEQWHRPT
jgi:hypothetical protein